MERRFDFNRLAYFVALYETGSFTLAAERLGVGKSLVSKQITRLERDFEVVLFERTTRMVRPTKAGATLYRRRAKIESAANKAFSELENTKKNLRRFRS